jgi:hypothetical protein
MKLVVAVMMAAAVAFSDGCGTTIATDLPNRLYGADGQPIVLEEIEAIVRDPDLGDDEKRAQLRDLGLEDEELITALLLL